MACRSPHHHDAQALDGHLVHADPNRCVVELPLKSLTNHSKSPGCFGAWTFACTGLAFFFGVEVGDGVAVGEGTKVTVGVGVLVGIRVGILVGIFVGVALRMAFLSSINYWLNSGWFVSTAGT
jgi:hypothetical protein